MDSPGILGFYDDGLDISQFINGLERSQLLDNSSSQAQMILKGFPIEGSDRNVDSDLNL